MLVDKVVLQEAINIPVVEADGTDISLYGGEWNSSNHLYSRIIVAGGGGGVAAESSNIVGGYGGGISGGNGQNAGGSQWGYGASQTSGGSTSGSSGKNGIFGMAQSVTSNYPNSKGYNRWCNGN